MLRSGNGRIDGRRIGTASLGTSLVLALTLAGCTSGVEPSAPPAEPTNVGATSTPSPSRPTSRPATSSPAPNQKSSTGAQPPAQRGSSATFEHFTVTVGQINYVSKSEALVQARVCVRSLPPHPQGDRTRISWDPWSVTAGTAAAKAGNTGDTPHDAFPADRTYRVGQCASGVIPFVIHGKLDTVRYANGVGDEALWDADDLARQPVTRTSSATDKSDDNGGIGEGTFLVGDDISPGRYQAKAVAGGLCYWARLKDDSGDSESIIANSATRGRASVTIKSSDGAFESSGCTPWVRQ